MQIPPMESDLARVLAEVVRIVGDGGEGEGVAIPSDMDLREVVRRLEQVADGAGWAAIRAALAPSSSA